MVSTEVRFTTTSDMAGPEKMVMRFWGFDLGSAVLDGPVELHVPGVCSCILIMIQLHSDNHSQFGIISVGLMFTAHFGSSTEMKMSNVILCLNMQVILTSNVKMPHDDDVIFTSDVSV